MIRGVRQSLQRAAERDTAPLRRLCAWILDREGPGMEPAERDVLQWAFDAIVEHEGPDVR